MASSTPRSFPRFGAQGTSSLPSHSPCILLDAALERCGSAPPKLDAPAAVSQACCDFEIKQLTQACWACNSLDAASCASAAREADIAIGMSSCAPSTPLSLLSSSPNQQRVYARNLPGGSLSNPTTLFLVTFFSVLSVLAVGVFSFLLHQWRSSRPYEKRAKRHAFLDLMEGHTPVEERRARSPDPPHNPWVQFQPDRAATPVPSPAFVPRNTPMVEAWPRWRTSLAHSGASDHDVLASPPPARVSSPRR